MRAIGERMKKVRTARGLSQIDVAEAAEVSRAAVSLWERGESGIEQQKLESVAERLRVDVVWLQWGRGKEPQIQINTDTRRAMRLANSADLGWSDVANKPPYENAVPELITELGSGAPYSEKFNRVREWWRLPNHVVHGCGTRKFTSLRMMRVAAEVIQGLPKGSHVCIDTDQKEFEGGQIYAIDTGASLILKQAISQAGTSRKIGLTDMSGVVQILDKPKVKVFGKVVARFVCG